MKHQPVELAWIAASPFLLPFKHQLSNTKRQTLSVPEIFRKHQVQTCKLESFAKQTKVSTSMFYVGMAFARPPTSGESTPSVLLLFFLHQTGLMTPVTRPQNTDHLRKNTKATTNMPTKQTNEFETCIQSNNFGLSFTFFKTNNPSNQHNNQPNKGAISTQSPHPHQQQLGFIDHGVQKGHLRSG